MNRRQFLLSSSAAVTTSLSAAIADTPANARPCFVVLTGIDHETTRDALFKLLREFGGMRVHANCLLDVGSRTSPSQLRTILDTVAQARLDSWGIVDVVPLETDVAGLSQYFQCRGATELLNTWRDAFEERGFRSAGHVVASDGPASEMSAPYGLRAAGVRTQIVLDRSIDPVRSELWEDGVLRLVGGTPLSKSAVEIVLERGEGPLLFYLDAQALLSPAGPASAQAWEELRAALGFIAEEPRLVSLPLSDAILRDDYSFASAIAIHLQRAAQNGETMEAVRGAGLPFTTGSSSQGIEMDGTSVLPSKGTGLRGMDSDGNLRLDTFELRPDSSIQDLQKFLRHGAHDKLVIVQEDANIPRPLLRTALAAIREEVHAFGARITSLDRLVRTSLRPRSSGFEHYRRTRAFEPALREEPPLARAELEEDARIAWAYFDRWTNPVTGLCPATADTQSSVKLHEAVTMWDVGSHLLALKAAQQLDLLTRADYLARVRRILPQIAGRVYAGRRLPQGWIRTDRHRWGTKDFDACDAARLLSALYNLAEDPELETEVIDLVQAYDLGETVRDGIIHSFKDGKWVSSYNSHCAHYAALTYRLWGYDVLSPYETFTGRGHADGRVALLEAAGQIGPLGAEPLLMEALELGMTPESQYLADVLLSAQVEHFQSTGQLKCVSETPLDRDPWFLYTGLQLDAGGIKWATDTVESLEEHRSEAFAARHAVSSPKAAYLWAAYSDDPFGRMAVRSLRERARTSIGFASAIYEQSGQATEDYADINTNAVILQSIAMILQG